LTRDKVVGLKASICSSQTNNTTGTPSTKKKKPAAQQKSISSFFKATAASSKPSSKKRPRTSAAAVAAAGQQQHHHEEGRFQFFMFADKDIVQTYVPNHGMKMEKWEKRKQWDLQVLEFVQQRQQILEHVTNMKATSDDNNKHRTLLWCGDLNVAHTYMDGTHWKKKQTAADDQCYEWWTDESKCIIQKKNKAANDDDDSDDKGPKDPQYVGMPSFTPAERTRFICFLKRGKLVDVWRCLHPDPCDNWNAPHWTWRGKGPVYGNKGQRLDYFLLSESDTERVESCRILGTGNHKGLFCGSDHCASLLVLKRE
jgi:exonuclease III